MMGNGASMSFTGCAGFDHPADQDPANLTADKEDTVDTAAGLVEILRMVIYQCTERDDIMLNLAVCGWLLLHSR
jgi:hypothetical protein